MRFCLQHKNDTSKKHVYRCSHENWGEKKKKCLHKVGGKCPIRALLAGHGTADISGNLNCSHKYISTYDAQNLQTDTPNNNRNEKPGTGLEQLENVIECSAHVKENKKDSTTHAGVIMIEGKDRFGVS